MNISNEITYVATDEQRQIIAYVHAKDLQGRVTEYFAKDSTLTKDQIAKADKRRMDCVDCHNRPTHIYVPPDMSVDRSFAAHRLDITLPFLKQQSVAALTGKYNTTDAAMQGIAKTIDELLRSKYPDLARNKQPEIRGAIDELQRIYKLTFFPEMKLDWRTHPNNIGHFYFPGCFRCHDGNHVSPEGKVIPQGLRHLPHHSEPAGERREHRLRCRASSSSTRSISGDMTAVNCSDCHTGGVSP